MSTSPLSSNFLGGVVDNQRLAIGATISFLHASVVITLLFDNLQEWQFILYAAIPALTTIIVPFLITRPVINRWYPNESMESYLTALTETTGEDTPPAAEVEMDSAVHDKLPEEVEDPDSVKVVQEELLDHIDGETFDPVDADTRGVVAMGFAGILIVPSAPITGILVGGMIPVLVGVFVALGASWIVLQQHREMVGLIEYTPQVIDS